MEAIEFEHVALESLRELECCGGEQARVISPYAASSAVQAERKLREVHLKEAMTAVRSPASPADLRLSEQALVWLIALPDAVRPLKLAASFPRVANRLCQIWNRPVEMDRYFEDLLTDKRGGRQGFPFSVALELTALSDHYRSTVYPVPQTIWDDQYLSNAKAR
jgi:hypothetical protein